MSEQRKSLSHDALWNFVSTGTKAVSALVIFWLLARKLGTENYGVYTATLAVFLLTAPFVVVGSFHIVIRRVSRDRSLAPSAWGATLLPTFVFSFLASAIVAWLGSFLAPGMDKSAVFVLGLSEYLGLGIVYNATFLLQALNKYSTTAAITVVWSIARMVAAVIALVVLEPSFLGISVGLLIAAGVASVMASALAWREAGPPTFSFKESVTLSGQGMPFSFPPPVRRCSTIWTSRCSCRSREAMRTESTPPETAYWVWLLFPCSLFLAPPTPGSLRPVPRAVWPERGRWQPGCRRWSWPIPLWSGSAFS